MRKGRWKLIEFFEDGRLELYNLAEDMEEKRNMTEEQPIRVKELHERLESWRNRVGAKYPAENPKGVRK